MKDFQLRNETRLLFRNDPVADLMRLTEKKKVLFVYGSGSAKTNGCYADVIRSVQVNGGMLVELPNASLLSKTMELKWSLGQEEPVSWIARN